MCYQQVLKLFNHSVNNGCFISFISNPNSKAVAFKVRAMRTIPEPTAWTWWKKPVENNEIHDIWIKNTYTPLKDQLVL